MSQDPPKRRHTKVDPKYAHLQLAPETVLRKRHFHDDNKLRKESMVVTLTKKGGKQPSKLIRVRKPETIISQSKSMRTHVKRLKRVAKKGMQKRASNKPEYATSNDGNNKIQTNSVGAAFVFCVLKHRVHNNKKVPRAASHIIMNKFKLNRQNTGIFIKYNETNRRLLHMVEPFVVYGPVSTSIVSDLLTRRGYARNSDDDRLPLSDNNIIEETLGENLLCVADLVHEITTVGPQFEKVTQDFLFPFILRDAKDTHERKVLKIKDGRDDYGDMGERMNEFLQSIM